MGVFTAGVRRHTAERLRPGKTTVASTGCRWFLDKPPPIVLQENEVEIDAIRAQGKGGQNVNKVSNAVHLRFDVRASSLPDAVKARLLEMQDHRITADGVVVIKAQSHRSLETNREDALTRLRALIAAAAALPRPRRPTRATRGSKERRVSGKIRRGRVKALRGRVDE